jgi:inner membrane protease ATP23
MRSLVKSGCPVDADYFQCTQCPASENRASAFELDQYGYSRITLCENRIRDADDVKATMTHELVHAYDHCRANIDFNDCAQLACTEIRATNLSGDCSFSNERKRFGTLTALSSGIYDHHKACVRRRATLCVKSNPRCGAPQAAVDKVFDRCYNDTEPFGSVP